MNNRYLLIVSAYHSEITSALRQAAESTLRDHPATDDVTVCEAPGAFELTSIAEHAARTEEWDAILALGCLIRGETPHFEYISQAVASGLTMVSIKHGVPVHFGVITADTIEQARARSGLFVPSQSGLGKDIPNKGHECARAAILTLEAIDSLGADR